MEAAKPLVVQDRAQYPPVLLTLLRLVAIALGAANAAAGMLRQSMNADGMNYLDMGDAFMRGNWAVAINGTWSPLYSWILGLALWLFEPSIKWEIPTVHLVNFVIFLAALVSFEYFWRQATDQYYAKAPNTALEGSTHLPIWAWLAVGYGLFIWSSLALIEVYAVTPDMCVAACVYLAGGLLLRIGSGAATRKTFAILGAMLGVGYLAKAAMFPLAFVFLAAAVLAQGKVSRGVTRVLPAVLAFAIVAGPFLVALSAASGHFTFSEVGKLTYLKHVHEVPFPHWQPGVVELPGAPEHPVQVIAEHPTIYEFASPVAGTYPLSFDPYYWYEGLVPTVDLGRQLKALAINLRFYFDLFFQIQGPFLGIVLVLTLMALLHRQPGLAYTGWTLGLVAVAAFAMYALVHVTYRYIGPFVVIFWAGLLLSVRLKALPATGRWLAVSGGALIFSLAVNIAAFHLEGLNALFGYVPSSGGFVSGVGTVSTVSARPSEVAQGLVELDLQKGDRVGFIGYSFDAFWARLARLKIVAEIVPEEADEFWRADLDRQEELLRSFSNLGVSAVVAQTLPSDGVMPPGWTQIGQTRYYAYLFPTSGAGR
jgi:hypothetical protein